MNVFDDLPDGCFLSIFIVFSCIVLLFVQSRYHENKNNITERELQEFSEVVIKYADKETIDKINKHYMDKHIENAKVFQLQPNVAVQEVRQDTNTAEE